MKFANNVLNIKTLSIAVFALLISTLTFADNSNNLGADLKQSYKVLDGNVAYCGQNGVKTSYSPIIMVTLEKTHLIKVEVLGCKRSKWSILRNLKDASFGVSEVIDRKLVAKYSNIQLIFLKDNELLSDWISLPQLDVRGQSFMNVNWINKQASQYSVAIKGLKSIYEGRKLIYQTEVDFGSFNLH